MPIYDFECEECGHVQEELILTKDDIPKCMECGNDMKRIMSSSNFILKGRNWAKDSYGLKESKKEKTDL